MICELLYKCKGVTIINPAGSIAICTLWTPPDMLVAKIHPKYPVACIGGLYGGGVNYILRNLLHNPQIDTLIVFGKELGHGSEFLEAYFKNNIRKEDTLQQYKDVNTGNIVEHPRYYIHTNHGKYLLDPFITPDRFIRPINYINLSTTGVGDMNILNNYLDNYITENRYGEREDCPELVPVSDTVPNDTFSHMVSKPDIISAWKEMLFKCHRFGETRELSNGKVRKELNNLKVVIQDPCYHYTDSEMSKIGISYKEIDAYSGSLLSKSIEEGQTYSYGNRLTQHFNNENNINKIIEELDLPGDRRRCYITLWDNTKDILSTSGRPCMVSLFFRKIDNQVHMTTTFRSHSAALAWAKNAFGLAEVLTYVCGNTNECIPGTLTLISHSISLDPNSTGHILEHIEDYIAHHPSVVLDPYGHIQITIDKENKLLHAIHYDKDHLELGNYNGPSPEEVQHQLYTYQCISDIGHAMYIGNQLEKAYICLNNGIEYIQDKKIIKL